MIPCPAPEPPSAHLHDEHSHELRRIAGAIDHTLLRPEATEADVVAAAIEAYELAVVALCVSSSMVRPAARESAGLFRVASTIGFPSGAVPTLAKTVEACAALGAGASELDMVMNLGAAKSGDWRSVANDIAAVVREAQPAGALVKVIIESAALTAPEIVEACHTAVDAGAAYVKTSTGFHPAGGATVEAVRLMVASVPSNVGVKASGGIRDLATARAMLDAGARRLGTSSTASILLAGQP